MYELIKGKLKTHPEFRERSKRGYGLCKLALRACGLEGKEDQYTESELIAFALRYESYERAWRAVTNDCVELRGKDYSDKIVLEQEKQLELGYEPKVHTIHA